MPDWRLPAEVFPASLLWQVNAAVTALSHRDHETARRYASRARALPIALDWPGVAAIGWLFDAHEAWLRKDPASAAAIADAAAADGDSALPPAVFRERLSHLTHLYLALGQTRRARATAERGDALKRKVLLLRAAYFHPEPGHLSELLRREYPDPSQATHVATALIDAGLLNSGREALARLRLRNATSPDRLQFLEGQLAYTEGRLSDAAVLLQQFINTTSSRDSRIRAGLKLADIHARQGQPQQGIALLEALSSERFDLMFRSNANGFLWLPVRERLAELLHRTGRHTDAESVESELRALLAHADDDHPIKRRLGAGRQESLMSRR